MSDDVLTEPPEEKEPPSLRGEAYREMKVGVTDMKAVSSPRRTFYADLTPPAPLSPDRAGRRRARRVSASWPPALGRGGRRERREEERRRFRFPSPLSPERVGPMRFHEGGASRPPGLGRGGPGG